MHKEMPDKLLITEGNRAENRYDIIIVDLVGQSNLSFMSTKNYYFATVSMLVSAKQVCYHYVDKKPNI